MMDEMKDVNWQAEIREAVEKMVRDKKKPHSLAEARQLRMKMLPINSSAVEMIREAYWIAVEDRIAFYDSLFLAASEKENAPLLTMDRKLYERAKQKRNVQMI